jgi:hypothetical protein
MAKEFQFEPRHEYMPDIEPIRNHIPEWYKTSKRFFGDGKPFEPGVGTKHALKLCVPFLDGLTFGYTLLTHCDIVVEQKRGIPHAFWRDDMAPLGSRSNEAARTLPIPAGHSPYHFIWSNQTSFRVPNGYSIIFTHPLNRFDLPFTTLSGVIDSDDFVIYPGNIPFFFREGFEGMIPRGTPIAQLMPFKRENWKLKKVAGLTKVADNFAKLSASYISGWYKRNVWKRKNFD